MVLDELSASNGSDSPVHLHRAAGGMLGIWGSEQRPPVTTVQRASGLSAPSPRGQGGVRRRVTRRASEAGLDFPLSLEQVACHLAKILISEDNHRFEAHGNPEL